MNIKGFIITGFTYHGGGRKNILLARTDSIGDSLWAKTYGDTANEVGLSIELTPNGGFMIVGYTESYGNGGKDLWLIKTDSIGNLFWSKTYGWNRNEIGYSIDRTSDGNYIIAGFTTSTVDSHGDVWLLKVTEDGDTIWTRFFNGLGDDRAYSVKETEDRGFIIAGESKMGSTSYIYLIKTDSDGTTGIQDDIIEIEDYSIICYPNPFYSSINIDIIIPEKSKINLLIYDILGRYIKTLINKKTYSNHIHLTWDGLGDSGNKVPSGFYFLRLEADGNEETRKLLLIR